jgi:hypothetical protein
MKCNDMIGGFCVLCFVVGVEDDVILSNESTSPRVWSYSSSKKDVCWQCCLDGYRPLEGQS